ncbi:MAG: tyrosine-type recombinase/integrase [Acidobacteriota bacterium]|nr:tyrosine-type recombinase/integrase [Acidobacteriota bacterium]
MASRWLETRYFGRAQAETTSAEYASSVALFLSWAELTGRDLTHAARDLHLFVSFLATTPIESGRSAGSARTAGRINRILMAVREMYRFGAGDGTVPVEVIGHLYELAAREGYQSLPGSRVRHRRREPRRASEPDHATSGEVLALLRGANTARDRFLILLLAVLGLRVGQALGLRHSDVHLVPDVWSYGLEDPARPGERCRTAGEHLHVVRRRNPNGAWSKARFDFCVQVPPIMLGFYDAFMVERDGVAESASNDMLIVALAGPTRGEAITARNVNKLFERLSSRACDRPIVPHMLRHFAASEHLSAGATRDELQALLGWSNIASAQPYIHISDAQRRAAVERLADRLGNGAR